VDTDAIANGSNERVELIFERIAETGERLNVPVLIGEWGALHGKSPDLIPVADHLTNIYNKYGFSDTFWAYGNFLFESSFLDVLKKPYPMTTSGELLEYSFDFGRGIFNATWKESPEFNAPTQIYIPMVDNLGNDEISIDPKAEAISIEQIGASNSGYIIVPSQGESITRSITLTIEKSISPVSETK
jgi:endoglycosylceramidase